MITNCGFIFELGPTICDLTETAFATHNMWSNTTTERFCGDSPDADNTIHHILCSKFKKYGKIPQQQNLSALGIGTGETPCFPDFDGANSASLRKQLPYTSITDSTQRIMSRHVERLYAVCRPCKPCTGQPPQKENDAHNEGPMRRGFYAAQLRH